MIDFIGQYFNRYILRLETLHTINEIQLYFQIYS